MAATVQSARSPLLRCVLLYLLVSSFLCALTSAQSYYEEKKNDPNNGRFYMGSRYGRSGQQTTVQVTPRNDRFFMGSRYGKRAPAPLPPLEAACMWTRAWCTPYE